MKNTHKHHIKCCWSYRFELIGLILLVLATILTILTLNSVGIAAMFLVGLVLCCYKHFSCSISGVCHPQDEEEEIERLLSTLEQSAGQKKATPKKSSSTKKAPKA